MIASRESMEEDEEIKRIPIRDIPRELIDSAGKTALYYTVGLMGIETNFDGQHLYDEKSWLIGTGVLIQVGKVKGILTAYHLVSSLKFDNSNLIGLILFRNRPYRYESHIQSADIVKIAAPVNAEDGPDLAFIKLYAQDISSIEAYSHNMFWNMDKRRDTMLNNPPDNKRGTWAILGYPQEKSKKTAPKIGFLENTRLLLLATFTEITTTHERDGFDYMDVKILYDGDPIIPLTFRGVSGGGLWHFPSLKCIDGRWVIGDPFLSGLAFFQTELKNDNRDIKCHGRRSIYDVVFNALQANS